MSTFDLNQHLQFVPTPLTSALIKNLSISALTIYTDGLHSLLRQRIPQIYHPLTKEIPHHHLPKRTSFNSETSGNILSTSILSKPFTILYVSMRSPLILLNSSEYRPIAVKRSSYSVVSPSKTFYSCLMRS